MNRMMKIMMNCKTNLRPAVMIFLVLGYKISYCSTETSYSKNNKVDVESPLYIQIFIKATTTIITVTL